MKKAVVIIPTYNESKNIKDLLDKIAEVSKNIKNWSIEVLVVDSHSPDGTSTLVKKIQKKYPWVHLLVTTREGLGRAYITGFNHAIERLDPFVLFEMDADLSHAPAKIPEFLKKIEGGADFVIGSRYRKGGSIPKNWAPHRKILSIVGNLVIKLGFMRRRITDWTSGYRAIKVWVVKSILPNVQKYNGYVFQVALAYNALNQGARIEEVPINFIDRKHGISKINSIQYITQTLIYVFRSSSFVKYVIVGFIGFAIDFGLAYLLIHTYDMAKPIANSISAEFAILSNFTMNNFWSFKHKQVRGGAFNFIKKLLAFNLVSSGAIVIQGVGMFLALTFLGDKTIVITESMKFHSWIIYKVFIIGFLIIPYSYFMYNKVVWKDKA